MATTISRIYYYNTKVRDRPGEAYKRLSQLKALGVNLVAFALFPEGPMNTRVTLFPEDTAKLAHEAKQAGWKVDGPHPALLVQGDDELGALEGIHETLYEADVNVSVSSGVADGRGGFGYVLYVEAEEYQRAVKALGI
jgi:hypothetical protein